MESIAIEKAAYTMMLERISKLKKRVNDLYPNEGGVLQEEWIENAELSHRLNISLRTLQSYRERGVIGCKHSVNLVFQLVSSGATFVAKSYVESKIICVSLFPLRE